MVFETPTETAEATLGQAVPTWSTFATVWCELAPVSGNERFIAQQLLATVSHTIRCRWLDGVTVKMRATYDGRIFQFQSVIDFRERRKELVITAVEEVPARA
jgi:SPP1 family predicted phage head-tail adaptor